MISRNFRTLPVIVAGLLLAAIISPRNAMAAVGRTTGSFSVSATGQANYSIQIWTPPGIQGIQPALALVYSGRGGDAYYGAGWNMAGLSKISRCSKTWAQDGAPRDVRNDLQDRFCLDGNQLKLTAGTYGVAGSTYQTELESFSRITAAGIDGNGPASFTVEGKNGLIYEYGNTTDSRIESVAQTSARAWLISKVRDRTGNAMLFTYTEDTVNGGFRISTIQYTQNTAAGVSPLYSVSFVYETIPIGEVDSSYFAGSQIKRITRVDKIDVMQGTTVVRRYDFTYESALSSTGKSRLASVQECGLTLTDCLAPTTFTYQNGTPGVSAAVSSGVSLPQIFSTKQMDVNGDGRMDIVYSSAATPGTGTIMVALANTSGGYGTPINTGVSDSGFADSIIIDYDSNGFEDLLMPYTGGTWWVMLGSASGLSAPTNTAAPVTATGKGTNAAAIDVDGDGRQDLVWADLVGYSGGDTISYRLRLATGGFSATVSNLVGPLPVDSQIATGVFRAAGQPNAKRVPDFNGDGRGDVAYMRVTQTWNEAKQKYTFTTRLYVACPGLASFGWFDLTGGTTEQYGDFNGDGRTDILVYQGGLKVAYSTGINFTTPAATSILDGAPFFVMDWDGDGYDDVLTGTGSVLNLYRSTGESFATGVSTGISANLGTIYIGDVNGDGLHDISYRDFSGVWQVMVHAGASPDLLLSATDGFGMSATFAYASLSQSNYTKYSDAVFPEQDYQGPLYVVSSLTASTGLASPTTYTQSFWYFGARLQLQGRGFEGFDAQRINDNRNGVYRITYRHRTFPYSGMPYQDDVLQPNNTTLIQRAQNVFSTLSYGTANETRFFPYPTSMTQKSYGLGGGYDGVLLATAVTSNTAIDATSGEITASSTTTTEASGSNGINAGATWTSTNSTGLFNDTINWCIGRGSTSQQTNTHSLVNGGAQTRSASSTWTGAMCRVTQTDVEPSSTTLRVTTTYGYDPFGHVSTQSVTGSGMAARTSTMSWGTDGYFLVSSVNPLGQTSTATYNYTAGDIASATDPNGLTSSFVYDNFGRKIQVTRPDGTYTTWSFNKCTDWVGACYTWDNNFYRVNQYNYANNGTVINWVVTFHDPAGRMVDRASINGASQQVNERWIYDSLSQLTSQSTPARLSGGEPFYFSSISYDLSGRRTQIARPRRPPAFSSVGL